MNCLYQKIIIGFYVCFFVTCVSIFSSHAIDVVSIQLKWRHQFQFAGYYAAIEKGFYEQEGIHVVLKERNTKKSHIQSVLDGEAEYGVADAGLLLDRMMGKPVVLLKQIFQHSPLIFVSLKSSNIISPFDMIGKVVMMDLEGHSDSPLIALFQDTIGDMNAIKTTWHSYNVEDLISGKIDVISAYITDLPYQFKIKNIPINIINPQNFGIDFYGDNFFTTENEIITHPERVEKMIRATIKGWLYALDNKNEIINLIQSKYNKSLSVDKLQYEAEMIDLMILPEITPLGSVNWNRFKKVVETYKKTGVKIVGDSIKNFLYKSTSINIQPSDFTLTPEEINWLEKHPDIIVGFDGDYAPYSFKNEKGLFEGIAVDYVDEIKCKTGLSFSTYPEGAWENLYQDTMDGKVDVIATLMIRPDRLKYFIYTKPYISLKYYIITRKDNNTIMSRQCLHNKKLVLVKDYSTTNDIREKFPFAIHNLVDTITDAVIVVSSGNADASVLALGMAQHIIAKHNISNLKFVAPYDQESFEQGFGIRKDLPELASILDKALKLIDNEERIRIFQRWSKLEIAKKETVLDTMLLSEEQSILTPQEKQWIENHPIIKVASCASWAPVEFVDHDGEYKGISIDYLHLISKHFGINFQIEKNISWLKGLDMLKRKELDLLTAVSEIKDHKNYITFSRPYLTLPSAIFTLDYISYVHKPESLAQKKIGVLNEYAIESYLIERYPEIEIVEMENVAEALKQLQYKSIYAYAGSIFITSYYIKQEGYNNIKISGYLDHKYQVSMGTRKDWPELAGIIQKGLESIDKNELNNIYKSWIPVNYEETVNYDYVWKLLLVCGAIFIIIAIWNRVLKNEVIERKRAEQEATEAQLSMINVIRELKAEKEKAEAAVKSKTAFLANISHEIRTPMNAVLGYIDVVMDHEDILEKSRKHLQIARASAASLLSLMNEILDVSKAESGKLSINNKSFNMHNVIHSVMDIMTDKALKKGLKIYQFITPDIPVYVYGDANRLRQILINLIDNAIKFTMNGNVTLSVKQSDQPDFIHFSVEDTGIGIDNEKLSTIFDPFVQLDDSTTRNYGGTGLGTTIVKHLVELMGGTINVQSEPNKGSQFYFHVHMPATEILPDELSNYEDNTSAKQLQILLVEDIIVNAKLVKNRLAKQGHTVDHAWNGREAIHKLSINQYDMVLMDIQMPLMNGIEATKHIRQMGLKNIPIIALTASVYQHEKQIYFDAGMNDIVSKPIDFNYLFKIIKKYATNIQRITALPEKSLPIIDGIDVKDAMDRIGDLDFILYEWNSFFQDNKNVADEISKALSDNDHKTAYEIAHRVKGVSANLSITKIYHIVSDICDQIQVMDIKSVQALLKSLEKNLTSISVSVKQLAHVPDNNFSEKSGIENTYDVLKEIQTALNHYDMDKVDQLLEKLSAYYADADLAVLLRYINDYNYEGALSEIQTLIDEIDKKNV